MSYYANVGIGGSSPSSLQQKVLKEALTDHPVENASRAFISTDVPQVLVLPWPNGTDGSGSLPPTHGGG